MFGWRSSDTARRRDRQEMEELEICGQELEICGQRAPG
jgi:hypothetical protein